MKNKIGSELSMNVIIIAAIALLILVILAVFIFRSGEGIGKGTSCESLNGKCTSSCDGLEGVWAPNPALKSTCPTEGDLCCQKIVGSDNP